MVEEKHSENRKYSIIDKDVFVWLNSAKKKGIDGLCFNKFKADFIIDGFIKNYKKDDEIELNGEVYHIKILGKKCFGKECGLFNQMNKACSLKVGVGFAG